MSREEEIRAAVQNYLKATRDYEALLIAQLGRKLTAFRGIDEYLMKEERTMAGIVSADGQPILVGQKAWIVDTGDWQWRILTGLLRDFNSHSATFEKIGGIVGGNYGGSHTNVFSTAATAAAELVRRLETNRRYLLMRADQIMMIQTGLRRWDGGGPGFNLESEAVVQSAWKGDPLT